MNTDHDQLRGEIKTRVLALSLEALNDKEGIDAAKVKLLHGLRVAEEELELAWRKLEGSAVEREFTHEETVNGIRAMLGKGNDE